MSKKYRKMEKNDHEKNVEKDVKNKRERETDFAKVYK